MARFPFSKTTTTTTTNNNNNAPTSTTPALLRSDLPPLAASTAESSGSVRRRLGHSSSSFATTGGGGKHGFGGKTTTAATAAGRGLGVGVSLKRHRKVLRDNIHGVTKGDIRRLARRGGVKRIQATIYDDTRLVLRKRLEVLLKDICAVVELSDRKTVCVTDVVFVLNRMGRPLYGFGEAER